MTGIWTDINISLRYQINDKLYEMYTISNKEFTIL